MKKTAYLISTLSLFFFICSKATICLAQELNEKVISVNYFTFPKKLLSSDIKNYAMNIQGPLATDAVFPAFVKSKISVAHLVKIDQADQADMVITLETGSLSITSKEQGSKKDYQGVLEYYITIKYSLPIKVIVNDKNKNVLSEEQLYQQDFSIDTESYGDPHALEVMYISEASFRRLCLIKTTEKLNYYLNDNYGSLKMYDDFYLFTAKGKKLKYDELTESLKTTKTIFKTDVVKKLSAEQAANLKSVEDVWKSELALADTTNAAARINAEVYYGLNFNLAFSSLWLANFDDASRYLNIAKMCKRKNFYYFDYQKNIKKLERLLSEYQTVYLMHNKK
jgi:hypothetical protein